MDILLWRQQQLDFYWEPALKEPELKEVERVSKKAERDMNMDNVLAEA